MAAPGAAARQDRAPDPVRTDEDVTPCSVPVAGLLPSLASVID